VWDTQGDILMEQGNVLPRVVAQIESDPHGGQSLLLFALAKTLDMPKGGHMYRLQKLREMTPETRKLAYGLMELMARQGNRGDGWQEAIARMERAIRG